MALYKEVSSDILTSIAKQQEEDKLRKLQEQAQSQQTKMDNKYNGGLGGFLGGIVGGIGQGISNIGNSVIDMLGSGVASAKDLGSILTTGKSAGENEKWLMYRRGTDNAKDAYAKTAGQALNAATDLATTVLPGVGAGSKAAKALGGAVANTAAGAIGGVADEFQQQGADANLESAANRAISGAAAGLATGGLNKKIGNATSKAGSALLNNKLATSTIGRGALSGAVGGATGAGTSAALGGGDVAQAALQGGLTGAAAGGTQAGLMSLANNIGANVRNSMWDKMRAKTVTNNGLITENGVPKTFYHGSPDANIEDFDISKAGKNTQSGENAIFFTDDLPTATEFSYERIPTESMFVNKKGKQGKVYERNLKMDNPLDLSKLSDNQIDGLWDYASNLGKLDGKEAFVADMKKLRDYGNDQAIKSKLDLNKLGKSEYDGIIARMYPGEDEIREYGVFNADNIKKIGNTSSKTEEPFTAYGESGLAKKTKGTQTAEALRRFGNTLEGSQTNVTRAAARDMGIESPGKVVENVRKKTGLTNLETQAQLAKELTGGADSLMDSVQRNALTAAEDGTGRFLADHTKVLGEVDSIVDKYATTSALGAKGIQNLKDQLRTDILNQNQDLLAKANNFKSQAQELRGKGIVNPSEGDAAKAKIYTEVANKLDDLSYSAIPKENVDAMFGATISEMRARATQAQNNGNKEIANAYNKLADALNEQPRTIKAYRSFKKDFVDISKINQLTGQAENGAGFQMASGATSGIKRFGNRLLQRPANAVLAKAGGAVNSVADVVDATGGNATTIPRAKTQPISAGTQNILGNYIGRTQGELESGNMVQNARKAADNETLQSLLADIQTTQNNVAQLEEMARPKTVDPMQQQLENIYVAMNNALAAGDIESYDELAKMYTTAYGIYQNQAKINGLGTTDSESKLSTAEKNQIAKLQSAGTALDQLESLYQKAGGGQGIIGGNIANFLGGLGLNSDVNTYNQLAQGLINQIGAAIGKTDSLNTEGEVQRALSLVPKITDDNQTAMNKIATLRSLLQQNTGTYNQLYGA